MANLVNEREALKEELARLAGGHGNTSFWEKVTGGASVAIRDTKDRLAEVNAEYKRLLNEWETETRAANDALIAADKAKDDKIREDRAAARKKEAAEAAEEAAEKAKKDAEEFKEGRVKALEDAKNFTMEVKLDKLSEFEQEIELEKLKTQNLKDELEARKQALKDYGVFNGENKKAIEAAEANIDAISAKKKQDIINNRNKKIEEERQATIDRVTALTATNSKKLTAIAKGTGIADATIKGAQAIQGAWASAPFPANIPAVALTTAETFANIQTIKGVAHGGMSNVPSESTYLLDKGERVLSPNQNKDFTDYLKSGGGGGMNVIVNNYGNDQVQARQEGNNIEIIIGQVKNAFTDEVNRGTGFAQTLQHTYGLTRRGFA
jgi:hypothetical protein